MLASMMYIVWHLLIAKYAKSDMTLLLAAHPSVQFDSPVLISIPHGNLSFCNFLVNLVKTEELINITFETCIRMTSAPFVRYEETVVCINKETNLNSLNRFAVKSTAVYESNLDNNVYFEAYYEWDEQSLLQFADYWFELDRKPTYKVVVARYKEDIGWLDPLQEHLVILNKGVPYNVSNEVLLPNVGREPHSYLWYIIENYEQLPEVLIFTQGDISDHHCGTNNTEYLICVESLRLFASRMGKATPRVIYKYDSEAERSLSDVSADGDIRILSTSFWDPKFNNYEHFTNLIRNISYQHNMSYDFDDWFVEHIQDPYPNPIAVYPNSLFSVHRRRIWRHPRSYYESLIQEVSYAVHPIEAHFMERSWFYIF